MKEKKVLQTKKKGKVLLILALILTLVTSTFTAVPVQAASKKSKALKAYSKFLSNPTVNWGGIDVDAKKLRFTLVYVDKDSVPELLVDAYTDGGVVSHVLEYFKIYGYQNGKVTELARLRDDFAYYKKTGVLATSYVMGGVSWRYYKLSGGKSTCILESFESVMPGTEIKYFDGNRQTISKSAFNKTLKQYTKGKKAAKNIKTYKNTKANRKKRLK